MVSTVASATSAITRPERKRRSPTSDPCRRLRNASPLSTRVARSDGTKLPIKLASTATADHSSVVGSHACPWRITVQPYQTINITVVDFSVPPLDGLWYSLQPTKIEGDTCTSVIGYVTEAGGSNVSLCAGMRREVVAYQSRGSAVQVAFTRRPSATPVLIKYTGESSTCGGGGWLVSLHSPVTAARWRYMTRVDGLPLRCDAANDVL